MSSKSPEERVKQTAAYYVKAWGENPLPATVLATLITAQHMRPFRLLPMLFPPVLLFSSYMNIAGYKVDSAGTTAAWSAIYWLLAGRRKQGIYSKFGTRGLIRGATLGLCAANVVGGGWAWMMGRRKEEDAN
ncbi:hypothetical protein NA57DRAFT_74136 [Rhizodiscina lignyota]|uniref:Uncharacterized protein n=1 Tax=Rhizodiscina lignyota TaxID=1504668 RepID=A0A9P4IJT2_9PEZI|nr:hypothetical protein NA57DRAFT_74136 [Rhizodiscina lignyota]